MKSSIKSNWLTRAAGLLPALLVAAVLGLGSPITALAGNSPVLKVNNKAYYGKTYGEWAVAYWQWALSFPTASSPLLSDADGSLAGLGQSGPVWFLGGTGGDSVVRTFTMPANKAIFLPVHQWIFGATVFDCDPSVPGVPCDVQTLKQAAADAAKAVTLMEVSIDGQTISDVKDFRVKSPEAFSVTVPADNVSGVPAGTYSPQVADGYYMLLSPLSVGSHTISVHVISPVSENTVTYNITVTN